VSAVRTLAVHLGGVLVGHLTRYPGDRTHFVVAESYLDMGPQRPVLSLSMARPNDETMTRALLLDPRHKSASVKAPPFFSNLLPEGALRRTIAQRLKTHEDRDFEFLHALGQDLPGAVVITPADEPETFSAPPGNAPGEQDAADPGGAPPMDGTALKFSLAGMQMKFSMLRDGERLVLPGRGQLGNYLVKPPSRDHEALPVVEAATMETARAAGMEVPEVRLVAPQAVEGLSAQGEVKADEPFYAIRRFDRPGQTLEALGTFGIGRIHMEDFAQVFNLWPHDKYSQVNHEMIGRTLLRYAAGLSDLKEMSRRMIFNLLMGNGDAHIKNWSLIYDHPQRPRLAPAYDLVPTVAYMARDTSMALNMGGVKRFDAVTLGTFATFLSRVGIADQVHDEVMREVRLTGQQVLTVWRDQYEARGVPGTLIQRIEAHQKRLPVVAELTAWGAATS
jgi:serine/threonine-protein kinase HipA